MLSAAVTITADIKSREENQGETWNAEAVRIRILFEGKQRERKTEQTNALEDHIKGVRVAAAKA